MIAGGPKSESAFYVHITVPGCVDDHATTFHFGPFSSSEEGRAKFPLITRELLDGYILWIDQKPKSYPGVLPTGQQQSRLPPE
jgi:hypothetical protein